MAGTEHKDVRAEQQTCLRHSASGLTDELASPQGLSWLWFGLFVFGVAFLGGSSRPDPIQSALLRPFAALLLIPALLSLRRDNIERGRPVLLLLALLLVWMIFQVIPLPPSVWQALDGRQAIAELDQLAGLHDMWRPISLAPFRSLDSIFGTLVPFVALLLSVAMRVPARILFFAVVAMGVINAVFAVLQVLSGDESPLYLYTIMNRNEPAGIFANENHSAVFSAMALLTLIRLALEGKTQKDPAWLRLSYAPALVVILLAVLVSGSRAGFAATFVALFASAIASWLAVRGASTAPGGANATVARRDSRVLSLASCALAIGLLVFAFLWFERSPAVADILNRSSFEDLRWSLWPILREMALDHWLTGTGFGSFDAVYRIYEPTALLMPPYVNHAHNDWAQLWIEGGVPSLLLLLALLGWVGRSAFAIGSAKRTGAGQMIFWVACIVILAAAELVDYPLRTPVFQACAAWLLLCLSEDSARARAGQALGTN